MRVMCKRCCKRSYVLKNRNKKRTPTNKNDNIIMLLILQGEIKAINTIKGISITPVILLIKNITKI